MFHTLIIQSKPTDYYDMYLKTLTSVKNDNIYSLTEHCYCTEEWTNMSLNCTRKSRLYLLVLRYRGAIPFMPAVYPFLYLCLLLMVDAVKC